MDTLRVEISYRPLRIGWAIQEGDFVAFRKAVRFSYALWGGRYNPILVVKNQKQSDSLLEQFRVDFIVPIGVSPEVQGFSKSYPHLITPFIHEGIFNKGEQGFPPYSMVLDIVNTLAHVQHRPEWAEIKKEGVKLFNWQHDDSLADAFLAQLGGYPDVADVVTDYRALLLSASGGVEESLDKEAVIPAAVLQYPGISFFSRYGLSRNYRVHTPWKSPGFYFGHADDFDDLVSFWNLRASDIPLWFVDPRHAKRYKDWPDPLFWPAS